ncbi:hypothetical protein [Oceanomicrobium pacificus]|uniref:Uncharacterized protein n=1 Tax=Oceanomicrobium pacificus TaxID=2692916 RepID=A0A6B0TU67_9RHOB|nr:hypothetical protein [Oceanomicrobium pacificus]MXU64764.1 hypothetical protein [Oceanomicrobium pacificus]
MTRNFRLMALVGLTLCTGSLAGAAPILLPGTTGAKTITVATDADPTSVLRAGVDDLHLRLEDSRGESVTAARDAVDFLHRAGNWLFGPAEG